MAGRGKAVYTDALANEVLAGIAAGMTQKDAAFAAGISEDTFGRWMKGQSHAPADFAEKVNRATPRRIRSWLGGLSDLARNGDGPVRLKAIESLLDRCAPEYRKTERHEITGKDGEPFVLQLKVVTK